MERAECFDPAGFKTLALWTGLCHRFLGATPAWTSWDKSDGQLTVTPVTDHVNVDWLAAHFTYTCRQRAWKTYNWQYRCKQKMYIGNIVNLRLRCLWNGIKYWSAPQGAINLIATLTWRLLASGHLRRSYKESKAATRQDGFGFLLLPYIEPEECVGVLYHYIIEVISSACCNSSSVATDHSTYFTDGLFQWFTSWLSPFVCESVCQFGQSCLHTALFVQ